MSQCRLEVSVVAESDKDDVGKTNVTILFPANQRRISIRETAHILVAGISLLVKSCDKDTEMSDHELIGEIIQHMNDDFVSVRSFSDAKVNRKVLKK